MNEYIEKAAFFNFSYGLFVLTAFDEANNRNSGCIINTAMQITENPKRIVISLNKDNYSCELLRKSGKFNLSIINTSAKFDLFKRFGFCSGKDTDKFADFKDYSISENGIPYINDYANSFISAKLIGEVDAFTHTIFIAEVTEAEVLNDIPSVTYDYYSKNIKPNPNSTKKKGYVCQICGYVYEGDELSDDFICPLCKHGVDFFEEIE